jgi:hypothetical protein
VARSCEHRNEVSGSIERAELSRGPAIINIYRITLVRGIAELMELCLLAHAAVPPLY